MERFSATEKYYMDFKPGQYKIESRAKGKAIRDSKTKREKEFYDKYGIWGTKSAVDEYFSWKERNRNLFSPREIEDDDSLEEARIKELKEIEKEETELDL
jgi:hypothetical protein